MTRTYVVRPYLTPEEYTRLVDVIDVLEDKALVVTGVETGMRVSEITAGFPVEMIAWDAGTAQIKDEKKDLWRTISLSAPARNLIRMYLNADRREKGPVFRMSYKTANRRLKFWTAHAGIRKYRDGREVRLSWHAVRHTFVKLSKASGRDPMAIAQQLGDSLGTVMKIYGTWEASAMTKYFDGRPLLGRPGETRP